MQAALLDTVGSVYLGLGLGREAEQLIEASLASRRRINPELDLAAATTLQNLALLRLLQGKFDGAAEAAQEALAIRTKILGEDHESVTDAKLMYAVLLTFKAQQHGEVSEEAEILMRHVLARRREHLGNDHPHTSYAMIGLGSVLLNKIHFTQSNDVGEVASLFSNAAAILVRDPETKSLGLAIIEFQRSRLLAALKQWPAAADASTKGINHFRQAVGGAPSAVFGSGRRACQEFAGGQSCRGGRVICRGWEGELSRATNRATTC